MKIVGIVRNDGVTGIVYGEVEIPDPKPILQYGSRADDVKRAFHQAQKLRQQQFAKTRKNIKTRRR